MKYIQTTALIFFIAGTRLQAQDKHTAFPRQVLEAQRHIFKARSASHMQVGIRQFTSEYDQVVKKSYVQ